MGPKTPIGEEWLPNESDLLGHLLGGWTQCTYFPSSFQAHTIFVAATCHDTVMMTGPWGDKIVTFTMCLSSKYLASL